LQAQIAVVVADSRYPLRRLEVSARSHPFAGTDADIKRFSRGGRRAWPPHRVLPYWVAMGIGVAAIGCARSTWCRTRAKGDRRLALAGTITAAQPRRNAGTDQQPRDEHHRRWPRLRRRIGSFARNLTAREAANYFRHAGYAWNRSESALTSFTAALATQSSTKDGAIPAGMARRIDQGHRSQ